MSTWEIKTLGLFTATDPNCGIWMSQVQGLLTSGFTNYACPFGIMIAGDGTNDYVMKESAAFIAEMFDQDRDGKLDAKMKPIRDRIGAASESGGYFLG